MKRNWNISAAALGLAGCAALVLCLGANDDEKPPRYQTIFVPAPQVVNDAQGAVNVHGENFAREIQKNIQSMAARNWVVEQITPVIDGRYAWRTGEPQNASQRASAFGYGYGYSVTSGVAIVFREL